MAGRLSHGESVDCLLIAVLGVAEGEAAVDFQGLAAGVTAVGLDECVVDALALEPGEQEVPQLASSTPQLERAWDAWQDEKYRRGEANQRAAYGDNPFRPR